MTGNRIEDVKEVKKNLKSWKVTEQKLKSDSNFITVINFFLYEFKNEISIESIISIFLLNSSIEKYKSYYFLKIYKEIIQERIIKYKMLISKDKYQKKISEITKYILSTLYTLIVISNDSFYIHKSCIKFIAVIYLEILKFIVLYLQKIISHNEYFSLLSVFLNVNYSNSLINTMRSLCYENEVKNIISVFEKLSNLKLETYDNIKEDYLLNYIKNIFSDNNIGSKNIIDIILNKSFVNKIRKQFKKSETLNIDIITNNRDKLEIIADNKLVESKHYLDIFIKTEDLEYLWKHLNLIKSILPELVYLNYNVFLKKMFLNINKDKNKKNNEIISNINKISDNEFPDIYFPTHTDLIKIEPLLLIEKSRREKSEKYPFFNLNSNQSLFYNQISKLDDFLRKYCISENILSFYNDYQILFSEPKSLNNLKLSENIIDGSSWTLSYFLPVFYYYMLVFRNKKSKYDTIICSGNLINSEINQILPVGYINQKSLIISDFIKNLNLNEKILFVYNSDDDIKHLNIDNIDILKVKNIEDLSDALYK